MKIGGEKWYHLKFYYIKLNLGIMVFREYMKLQMKFL